MFCSAEDCDRLIYSRDLCEMHYRRWLRHGDPNKFVRTPGQKTCVVHGCRKRVNARGLCHGHYQRLIRGSKRTDADPLSRRIHDTICSVPTCGRPMSARGLCKTHLTRLQKFGGVQADKPIRTKKGEGYTHHGYHVVPVPIDLRHLTNGEAKAAEHRLIMAMHLGRPILPDESVHHRNGDRRDNRIENLELWSRYQPRGQRVEDKIAWAQEVVRRYGDLLGGNVSTAT